MVAHATTLPELPFSYDIQHRESERFGPYRLSVQASSYHNSWPHKDGLPINAYEHVEVAILYTFPDGHERFIRPQDARLPDFWAYDDVATMTIPEVAALRRMLIRRTQATKKRPHRGVLVRIPKYRHKWDRPHR